MATDNQTIKVTIYDLGYSKTITKDDDFYTENAQVVSKVTSGVAASNVLGGESTGNTTMADGSYQSSNYVYGVSGWSLEPDTAYFWNVTISGTLVSSNIHIPDENTTANSFHVESDGDTWWGCTQTNFTADNENAAAYILKTGVVKFNSGVIAGWSLSSSAIYFNGATDILSSGMAPADFPFYAGKKYADRATAPFRVTPAGILNATGATISGSITITGGSGIGNLSDAGALAILDTADFSTDVSGATKPENNATVGADWSVNLSNIPATLGTPSADGLYLSSTHLGYYKSGAWTSFIQSNGNFYFAGDAGSHIDWNVTTPATLTIAGSVQATAGSIIATSYLSGTVGLTNTNIAAMGWTSTIVFSATDYRVITWAAGVLTTAAGTSYNILTGNTGNMATTTYIYLDIAVSTTELQHTTTATTANGSGKILIAVANPNSDTTSKATLQAFGGIGGQILMVDNIVANSASTNIFITNSAQIADAMITNAKVVSLDVAKLTAGSITSKAITLAVSAGSGDSYIAAGKTDFTNADSGFILGIDDSDSDKAKFYIGDSSNYLNWNGTDLLVKVQYSNIKLYETVVDSSGNGDYLLLSEAIAAGKKKIFIRSGVYIETSTIQINSIWDDLFESYTITGENRGNTIIKFESLADDYLLEINNYQSGDSNENNRQTISISNITFDGNYHILDTSNTTATQNKSFGSTTYICQSWTVGDGVSSLSKIGFMFYGTIDYKKITCTIYAADANNKPTGASLGSQSIYREVKDSSSGYEWYDFIFGESISVTAGNKYVAVISAPDSVSTTQYNAKISSSSVYSSGTYSYSTDSGSTWTNDTKDLAFKVYYNSYANRMVAYGQDVHFDNCEIRNFGEIALQMGGSINTENMVCTNCSFYQNFSTALWQYGKIMTVTGNTFKENNASSQSDRGDYYGVGGGLSCTGANSIISNNKFIYEYNSGLDCDGYSNSISNNIFLLCGKDTDHGAAITIAASFTGGGNTISLSGNQITRCNQGIYCGHNGVQGLHLSISANTVLGSDKHGMAFWKAQSVSINSNIIRNSSLQTNSTYSEILLTESTLFTISNNRLFSSTSGNSALYGIRLDANSNNNIVIGNQVYGADTNISDAGTGSIVEHNFSV